MSNELKPITEAEMPIQSIIRQVIDHEKDKLYEQRPRGIKDDIVMIIKKEIQ